MNKLLKKLLGLLFPGIDGENDDPVPDDPDTPDPDAADDLDLLDDDLPDDPPARAAPRRSDADDRLARLEAEVQTARRQADEVRSRQPAPVDETFQREEERLRNPETTEMERWQIQANRTLRDTQRQAQQAMFQAQDLSDRTRFESKIATDPRRAKYAERVEEEIQKARSRGQMNASREDAYYWMLGKDIADGKLKPKAKASATPNVNRGKPAGVRSDVQGRGRPSSDRDKLRARLENTNI
jgi:hypothetical protein